MLVCRGESPLSHNNAFTGAELGSPDLGFNKHNILQISAFLFITPQGIMMRSVAEISYISECPIWGRLLWNNGVCQTAEEVEFK